MVSVHYSYRNYKARDLHSIHVATYLCTVRYAKYPIFTNPDACMIKNTRFQSFCLARLHCARVACLPSATRGFFGYRSPTKRAKGSSYIAPLR